MTEESVHRAQGAGGLRSRIDYLPLARPTRGLVSEEEANFIPVD